MTKKTLNIIAPVFNEEGNITNFFEKVKNALKKIDEKYDIKIIFVNDGSIDNSLKTLESIKVKFDNIEIINFTKNFGHQSAILAGLKEYKSDLYLVLDTDLQHDPNLIEVMIDNLEKSNSL